MYHCFFLLCVRVYNNASTQLAVFLDSSWGHSDGVCQDEPLNFKICHWQQCNPWNKINQHCTLQPQPWKQKLFARTGCRGKRASQGALQNDVKWKVRGGGRHCHWNHWNLRAQSQLLLKVLVWTDTEFLLHFASKWYEKTETGIYLFRTTNILSLQMNGVRVHVHLICSVCPCILQRSAILSKLVFKIACLPPLISLLRNPWYISRDHKLPEKVGMGWTYIIRTSQISCVQILQQ